jgi:hypothetical protein
VVSNCRNCVKLLAISAALTPLVPGAPVPVLAGTADAGTGDVVTMAVS